MKRWEELFEKLVWSFGEREFKRYVKGFLIDSKKLAEEIDSFDLQLISEYIPNVFWNRLRKRDLTVYGIDALIEYFFKKQPEGSIEGAENFLIVNSLFWNRFKKGYRKSSRVRPKEEYYINVGAFFYRISYQNYGALIYKLMEIHYRSLVEELRKLKKLK